MTFQEYLQSIRACEETRTWAAERTAQQAWDECERADWLMWWLAKSGMELKQLVLIACRCARTALQYVPAGEHRPLQAIETAEAWCNGLATLAEVSAAAAAAAYAAYAAYDAAYAADADAVRTKTLARMAKIVRKHYPTPPRMR